MLDYQIGGAHVDAEGYSDEVVNRIDNACARGFMLGAGGIEERYIPMWAVAFAEDDVPCAAGRAERHALVRTCGHSSR